jgi:hypothetical protein
VCVTPPDEIKKGYDIMMILNINTTSTPNQFKAFGEAVNVPYRVTLRDYRLASETRPSNYGKGLLYNDNLYDLMGVVKNGKLVLSSRWQSEIGDQNGYDLNDTKAIEAAITSWENMVQEKGRIFAEDGSSKITRKLLVADPPPVDKPASASDKGKDSWFSNLGSTDFSKYTTQGFLNFGEGFKLSGSSAKTVKHPSTFRGKNLELGKKVAVSEQITSLFNGKGGKNYTVYVELTEKGYIVSSPALDKQYRVNVNSPSNKKVPIQLEQTVLRAEKEVQQRMSSNEQQSWDAINGYSS